AEERGAVAGVEALLFSVLILVAGSVLLVNAWAVLDTRAGLDAAAREFTRSFTEQQDAGTALRIADSAARASLEHRGIDPDLVRVSVELPLGFGPCAPVEVSVQRQVAWLRAPFLGQVGDTLVRVEHRELVDAHREVTPSADFDPLSTECATG
ncbi:MAG: hypothetical protein ACYC2O_10565, partial [Microthrixaceae bacterium]